MQPPSTRPQNPCFGSGPTAKRPGWSVAALERALTGRSHRSAEGKKRLVEIGERSRRILGIPADYRIGILPGSDTGAFEAAMWSMLGARGVDALAFESFGEGWVTDLEKQLKLADLRVLKAPYGELPDLAAVDPARDTVFCWNGTTSGARIPDGDWISDTRQGLTLCDATSAAFAMDLALAQARCRHLVLAEGAGRRGAARHAGALAPRGGAPGEPQACLAAAQDLPPDQGRQGHRRHLPGRDHQHPLHAGRGGRARRPRLGRERGRPAGLIERCRRNLAAVEAWVERAGWPGSSPRGPEIRSPTSVCLTITDPAFTALAEKAQQAFVKDLTRLLAEERVAYDIASYRDAPAGLRLWCGATVETADIEALLPWLDWAFATTRARLA